MTMVDILESTEIIEYYYSLLYKIFILYNSATRYHKRNTKIFLRCDAHAQPQQKFLLCVQNKAFCLRAPRRTKYMFRAARVLFLLSSCCSLVPAAHLFIIAPLPSPLAGGSGSLGKPASLCHPAANQKGGATGRHKTNA